MTTLFLRDSVEELPAFTGSLNGIALSRRLVEKSIACIQDFVFPRFTQRDFFSDDGIILLVSAINAAGSMRDQSTCEPWANVLPDGYEATLVDLKKAYDVVVVRRKEARDTSERWFGVRSVESSKVGEPSCRAGVRISNVVEVGQVEYLSGSVPALEKENGRGVWHLLPLLPPNGCLNLTMIQSFCQREEGCILETPILSALWRAKKKLLDLVKVVAVAVLHQSSSLVPDNLTYHLHFKLYLVFRVYS